MLGPHRHGHHRPRPRSGLIAAIAVIAAAGLVACGGGDGEPPELRGWRRTEVLGHRDVVAYDQVATTSSLDGLAWVTRVRGGTGLAHWSLGDGDTTPQVTTLTMPDAPVTIPVTVASDLEGWAAVAVTREVDAGENLGLVAWRSTGRDEAASPEPLTLPDPAAPVPSRVTTARARGTTAVVGVSDGEVVVWSHDGGDGWDRARPDLGVEEDLVTAVVTGDGDRLVLAGVDADHRGHVWTATDPRSWQPVGGAPNGTGSVTALGPLARGRTALAWLAADGSPDAQRKAGAATVQVLDGDRLDDHGTVRGDPDARRPHLSLTGAAETSEGDLVLGGVAWTDTRDHLPMVWARDGDEWRPSSQPELAGRLDHDVRALAPTDDDGLRALVVPSPRGIDVELWAWRPPGD